MDPNAGTYLYCFARPGAVRDVEAVAVDGRPALSELEFQRVAAVFSEVSVSEFGSDDRLEERADPDWIIPRACRHERVIEEIMSRSPVLPVRFGAIFSTRRILQQLLGDRYSKIASFLEQIAGKEEWSIKCVVDMEMAGAWQLACKAADPVQRLQLSASPGTRYLQEKQLWAGMRKQVKHLVRTVARRLQEDLAEGAIDTRCLALLPFNVSGRAGEMVLNLALLLQETDVAAFHARVEGFARRYAEQGFTVESSGPWPPFNFCPALKEG